MESSNHNIQREEGTKKMLESFIQSMEQEIEIKTRQQSQDYNFNFEEEVPIHIPNSTYKYTKLKAQEVPSAYTRETQGLREQQYDHNSLLYEQDSIQTPSSSQLDPFTITQRPKNKLNENFHKSSSIFMTPDLKTTKMDTSDLQTSSYYIDTRESLNNLSETNDESTQRRSHSSSINKQKILKQNLIYLQILQQKSKKMNNESVRLALAGLQRNNSEVSEFNLNEIEQPLQNNLDQSLIIQSMKSSHIENNINISTQNLLQNNLTPTKEKIKKTSSNNSHKKVVQQSDKESRAYLKLMKKFKINLSMSIKQRMHQSHNEQEPFQQLSFKNNLFGDAKSYQPPLLSSYSDKQFQCQSEGCPLKRMKSDGKQPFVQCEPQQCNLVQQYLSQKDIAPLQLQKTSPQLNKSQSPIALGIRPLLSQYNSMNVNSEPNIIQEKTLLLQKDSSSSSGSAASQEKSLSISQAFQKLSRNYSSQQQLPQ